MNDTTVDAWIEEAERGAESWRSSVSKLIQKCIDDTDTSVVSAEVDFELSMSDGVLSGVPYAIKDLFDLKGYPTHSSSVLPPMIENQASADAEVVAKMHDLGAVCVAKTQMNEFAYGLSGENPHYGDCPHPKMRDCLSGGSSSGSAYMVAEGVVPVAFGTDTGGSIRLPAAWCGIYGIRWTPDYCMKGAFPLAPSFDTMGWFTRTSHDMTQMLEAWFGCSAHMPVEKVSGAFFMPKEHLSTEVSAALDNYVDKLGLTQIEGEAELRAMLPKCQFSFNVLQSRDAYAIHERWLSEYAELYDPQVRGRILRAEEWSDAEVNTASETKEQIKRWFEEFFERHDFLVMPICPGPSIPVEEMLPETREQTLQLTTPASLAGLPALSVPIWLDSKRSVGLQFIFKEVDPQVPLGILHLCENI